MLNLRRCSIDHFIKEVRHVYKRTYSDLEPQFENIIAWTGYLALENIANSDALYHNLEHTIMVSLAGQSILEGKHLCEGGVTPRDWMHFMIALLCHDIGYVRGVCRADKDGVYATGVGDETVELPKGCSDVALTPYHVNRSILFVQERFGKGLLEGMEKIIDVDVITSYIDMTKFPVPEGKKYKDTKNYPGLVRAADFIGQLGEPNYLRKSPALFYEFEETGTNEKFGYKNPGDLRATFAKFYWDVVRFYVEDALDYLRITQDGKQWIANLYSQVFRSEHGILD